MKCFIRLFSGPRPRGAGVSVDVGVGDGRGEWHGPAGLACLPPVDVPGEEGEVQALEPAQEGRRQAAALRQTRIHQTLLRPPGGGC